jgi:hypothetical protein
MDMDFQKHKRDYHRRWSFPIHEPAGAAKGTSTILVLAETVEDIIPVPRA